MAFNLRKIFFPTASDLFAPHVHMKQLADSIPGAVVPVANATEMTQLVQTLNGAGLGPSEERPLYVFRGDLGVEQVTTDGTAWRRLRPFAEAEGRATFPQPGGNGQSIVHIAQVTFPSSAGFTLEPVITGLTFVATEPNDAPTRDVRVHAYDVTRTGFKVFMDNAKDAPFNPSGRTVHWSARQATVASAI